MSEKAYHIRPLVWRRKKNRFHETWEAPAIEGAYRVERRRANEEAPWRGWSWSFEDRSDWTSDMHDCRTAKEGKAAAEAHWRETITRFLEEVNHG